MAGSGMERIGRRGRGEEYQGQALPVADWPGNAGSELSIDMNTAFVRTSELKVAESPNAILRHSTPKPATDESILPRLGAGDPARCSLPVATGEPERGVHPAIIPFRVTAGNRVRRAGCEGAESEGPTHLTQYGRAESKTLCGHSAGHDSSQAQDQATAARGRDKRSDYELPHTDFAVCPSVRLGGLSSLLEARPIFPVVLRQDNEFPANCPKCHSGRWWTGAPKDGWRDKHQAQWKARKENRT